LHSLLRSRRLQAKAACDKYFKSASRESKLRDVESALAEPSIKNGEGTFFPTQIAPQKKFPDSQRLFALLVTGNPAMQQYLETSFAKPWWLILLESARGKKKGLKILKVV